MNLYKKIVRFCLVVCATFIFMSCQNVFSNLKTADNSDIPANMGRVTISVGDDARTILPNAPDFEKYHLEFENTSGTETHASMSLEEGSTFSPVDLVAGTWKITAYGQVTFNSTLTDVAQGSATITVEDGKAVQTSIDISSSIGASDGNFTWSISAPSDIEADSWSVSLQKWGSTDDPVVSKSGSSDDSIGFNEGGAVSLSDTIDCAAGYYLLTVKVNKGSQIASSTEIVLIHSGLTTEANLTFTEDDFVDTITIRGTVSITKNGEAVDPTTLTIKMNSVENEWSSLGSTTPDSEGNWSIEIEPLDESTEVYFNVYGSSVINIDFEDDVSVSTENISDIILTKDITTKTASGTVSITKDGTAVDDFTNLWISMYAVDGYGDSLGYKKLESNGSWEIEFETLDEPTEVYFYVYDYDTIDINFEDGLMISNEDISGIDLSKVIAHATASGTVSITKNGAPVDVSDLSISMYTEGWDQLGYTTLEADGSWSIEFETLDESTEVYFRVTDYDTISIDFKDGDWSISNEDVTDIALTKDFTTKTASGTLAITKNGDPVDPTILTICMKPVDGWNYFGETDPKSDGTWSIEFETLDESTEVEFHVYSNDETSDIDINFKDGLSISNEDVSGIELTKAITTKTASGTLAITKNGEAVDTEGNDIIMFLLDDEITENDFLASSEIKSDGIWSIEFETLDESTEVGFCVYNGGSAIWFKDGLSISNENVSGIELSKDFDTATVGGTVTAGTSDIDISSAFFVVISDNTNYMDAFMDADQMGIGYGSNIAEDGTWSTEVTLGDSALNVYVLFGDDDYITDAYTLNNTYTFTEGNTNISCVLSDMKKASVEIRGTITGLEEDTEYYLYYGPDDMFTTEKFYGAYHGSTSSSWNFNLPKDAESYNAYFWVWCEDGLYKTTSSYSLGTSDQTGIALDITQMDSVDMPY